MTSEFWSPEGAFPDAGFPAEGPVTDGDLGGYPPTIDDLTDPAGGLDLGLDPFSPDGSGPLPLDGTPYGADQGAVVGDPDTAAQLWHEQARPDSCAVVVQEFILDELTGVDHQEDDLVAVAEAHGWYRPGGGTPIGEMGSLLEHYGVPVERTEGASLDDLRAVLAGDGKALVAVDSDEIWTPGLDPDEPLDAFPGIPGQGADHAVQVTGIDDSDPASPVVILNDPGVPDGAGTRIPVTAFLDAWEDAGNYLVTAGGTRG